MPAEGALRDGTPAGLELIETLRWEPDRGFVRLERHLARLALSADALDFAHYGETVRAALEACVSGTEPLRVRLTLDQAGQVRTSLAVYEPLPAEAVWTLRIASVRQASGDPLVRHKTTRRATFEQARAEFSSREAGEVLLLNERGEVCEGTITTIFADFGDGVLLTPSLECGLLPGILRAGLLAEGRAREAVLSGDDLRNASFLHVGNSLRGLIAARLA